MLPTGFLNAPRKKQRAQSFLRGAKGEFATPWPRTWNLECSESGWAELWRSPDLALAGHGAPEPGSGPSGLGGARKGLYYMVISLIYYDVSALEGGVVTTGME